MRRIISIFTLFCSLQLQAQNISLAGAWDFAMGDSLSYNDYVMLPGSMLTNGKGNIVTTKTQWTGSLYDSSYYFNPYMEKYRKVGEMKFPFFLTPERHYTGKAWYRRSIYIPKAMKDQRITLFLERPHIETTVYVNGKEVGHQMSLSVPHRYDVTRYVNFGRSNTIAICVYNGIENVCVGQDSHSVTDQTQGNWNGITGCIELQSQPAKLNIRKVIVRPDADKKQVRVVVEMENHVDGFRIMPKRDYGVTAMARPMMKGKAPVYAAQSVEAIGDKKEFVIDLGSDAQLWDEFTPNLYQLQVVAGDDVYETTFGLRSLSVKGRQLAINNRPLFLRGTVENCCFPETGYPPMEESEWLRVFRKCKEYGINHVRFHSYCPPEAAFAAADRVGIYLQPEGPSWPNHGVKLRRGQKIDQYLLDESKRIIDEYGHHPSFCFMAAGNEPAGDWVPYCNDWVKTMKQYDPTKLYAGASVGGGWAWDSGSEYHVKAGARGLDWDKHAPSSDDDYYQQLLFPRNYKDTIPNNSPIVAHEQGQWCVFPDFNEIPQYTGVYKAKNFEIFQDLLRDNGMASQAEKFLHASGKLQTLCYKYETERNLRTKDYAGFQYLGLNDYSGQGTALVGPLNVHWREKGYVDAREWKQFCAATVALARFPKFVYTNDEKLVVPVEAYNAFAAKLVNAKVNWRITDGQQQEVANGALPVSTIPIGKNNELGTVRLQLAQFQQPAKLTLHVLLNGYEWNQWDFWVYPAGDKMEEVKSKNFYETDSLDDQAVKVLKKGGTVLLCAGGKIRYGRDVRHTFLPVFWNTSWFKMRPPHTTGAYIQSDHPVFRDFPTDDWQNLNWWELTNRTQVMNLTEFPKDYQPIVQPIDTWHVCRKLGMLIEARVLKGRLLMTTLPIGEKQTADGQKPAARQLRYSILSYMQSADFNPSLSLDIDVIRHLFERDAPAVDMFTRESPDELKPKIGG